MFQNKISGLLDLAPWEVYSSTALPECVFSIPVELDEELVAFFHFDNQEDPQAFTPEMLKSVESLSEYINTAFITA